MLSTNFLWLMLTILDCLCGLLFLIVSVDILMSKKHHKSITYNEFFT